MRRFESGNLLTRSRREIPCKSGRRDGGLTLLELTASIVVLVVVCLTSVMALVPINRQARISRELGAGVVAVENVVESIQLTPFENITTKFPAGQATTVSTLNRGEITVSYVDPDVDPLEIDITLTWDSPDLGSMSRTFSTARTK